MKGVVITGALGGIGTALCREFSGAGYAVVATDRFSGAVECHRFLQADITDLCDEGEARVQLLDRLHHACEGLDVSVVVNNAAVQILGHSASVSTADWRTTMDTNVMAPFLLAQAFLPMLERHRGSVVNVASIHAVATKPQFVAYATSKAALVGLTRAMAVDMGSKVRVNAIVPAAVATPMLLAGFEATPTGLARLAMMHPLGRIADPKEVAQAAVFLASEQAAFMTGSALHLDGGIGARLHDPI